MGHLFAAGGRTVDGDGVRELYIGSLAQVRTDVFPACIDYLALGHLHIPQIVGGSDFIRYSGSPLPIGFGEAEQDKCVVLVEFSGPSPQVTNIPVPRFQELKTLRGDWPAIAREIEELKSRGARPGWRSSTKGMRSPAICASAWMRPSPGAAWRFSASKTTGFWSAP